MLYERGALMDLTEMNCKSCHETLDMAGSIASGHYIYDCDFIPLVVETLGTQSSSGVIDSHSQKDSIVCGYCAQYCCVSPSLETVCEIMTIQLKDGISRQTKSF
jgi:hypothetical protein